MDSSMWMAYLEKIGVSGQKLAYFLHIIPNYVRTANSDSTAMVPSVSYGFA